MIRFNVILLLIVVACALSAVNSNHQARKLFIAFEKEQQRMRALDVEWGQLQLEQSTWAAHARVEKIARDRLNMKIPGTSQIMVMEARRP